MTAATDPTDDRRLDAAALDAVLQDAVDAAACRTPPRSSPTTTA